MPFLIFRLAIYKEAGQACRSRVRSTARHGRPPPAKDQLRGTSTTTLQQRLASLANRVRCSRYLRLGWQLLAPPS